MHINIKATNLDLTLSLRAYIDQKLGTLGKFIEKFDAEGVAEIWMEVGRTTRHHHKGNVFRAEADLRLPHKILRAVEESEDVRAAIDLIRNKLRLEIEKYRTRAGVKRRAARER